jgi:hypothetical protein
VGAERRARAAAPSRGRRPWLLPAGAGALALAALVIALAVSPHHAGPTLAQAAELSTRSAAAPAPPRRGDAPELLAAAEEGLPFPNWTQRFNWRPVGVRTDTVGGRHATTVFYAYEGHRVGYTIVSGPALSVPSGAAMARRGSIEFASLRAGGHVVVTWQRRGHTCVLTGPGVSRGDLLDLAGWTDSGRLQS